MARLRKEKGGSRAPPSSKPTHAPKKSRKGGSGDDLLREQVLALGGTQDDLDLLKDVSDDTNGGEPTTDPALSRDVSKFLQGLKFDGDKAQQAEAKTSEKPAKKPKQSALHKDKAEIQQGPTKETEKSRKGKKQKKDQTQDTVEPVVSKTELPAEIPKVQLPEKVSFDPKSKFIFHPIALWHTAVPLLPSSAKAPSPSPSQLSTLTSKAANLHQADTRTFQTSSSSNSSSSEASFLSKIIQSGTLSDRLSALTLLVQSSPIHNTKALETLKGMAERGKGKGGRDESLKALRCIVDWWVGGGAPDRKLKYFRDQPLINDSVTDEHLLSWYFEDWLKKYFFSILQILETLSLDPLPYVRTQALTLIFTLLRDKPEQEQNLLRLLVNKLGDTEKTLCSRVSYHLLLLMQSHPSMKGVIVREIIALVLRPAAPPPPPTGLPTGTGKHIRFTDTDPKPKSKPKPVPADKRAGNKHARYYATITFNQIVLTHGDRDVSLKLIDVYFEMFKELLGEDGDEVEDDEGEPDAEKEVVKDKRGRVRDSKGKGKGKKKGKGVTEVKGAAGFTEVEDAQSRLISAILTGVNRALPFAKIDAGDVGLNKHIDTLFLITHTSTFNISLQALVLIQQITASLMPTASTSTSTSSTSKSITDRYYRTLYASLHDTRLATSSKQAMYLNLLFKSIKADAGNHDGERVKAMVRRFVQVLVSGGGGATEFIAGGLFLLGELFSTIPGLRTIINRGEDPDAETYDPRKRDPQFSHASSSPLWELTPLLHHYHPAVSLHARQLLSSQSLTASADLSLNTLSHFLDRFVYKNPKKLKQGENAMGTGKSKGASAMQPAASGLGEAGVKLMKGEVDDDGLMNEDGFLKKRVEDVPVDQLFFHKFFSRKSEKEKAKASKASKRKGEHDSEGEDDEADGGEGEVGGDEESLGSEAGDDVPEGDDEDKDDSDADEGEIWKAMKATMPKAIGEDDDLLEESDDLPSDFDQEMNSDEESENEHEIDDETLSLVEGSGDEDLISLDGDLPDGLIEYDGSDEDGDEEEEWGGIGGDANSGGKKRKREDSSREKRKKLRSLPTFASYEDYAKMIEDGPEDDI